MFVAEQIVVAAAVAVAAKTVVDTGCYNFAAKLPKIIGKVKENS